jgi:hypothetical protein
MKWPQEVFSMRNNRLTSILIALAFLGGCSRKEGRIDKSYTKLANTPSVKEEVTGSQVGGIAKGTASKSEDDKSLWIFYSKELDFSLRLPSSYWKEKGPKDRKMIADFWCNPLGSPMLASVTAVKKQTKEQYEAAIPQLKANLEKEDDFLVKPAYEEGTINKKDIFFFAKMCVKGNSTDQYDYVAVSSVWLAEKGITVSTLFEGQGKMISKVFKKVEFSQFESAARTICLSPK